VSSAHPSPSATAPVICCSCCCELQQSSPALLLRHLQLSFSATNLLFFLNGCCDCIVLCRCLVAVPRVVQLPPLSTVAIAWLLQFSETSTAATTKIATSITSDHISKQRINSSTIQDQRQQQIPENISFLVGGFFISTIRLLIRLHQVDFYLSILLVFSVAHYIL